MMHGQAKGAVTLRSNCCQIPAHEVWPGQKEIQHDAGVTPRPVPYLACTFVHGLARACGPDRCRYGVTIRNATDICASDCPDRRLLSRDAHPPDGLRAVVGHE